MALITTGVNTRRGIAPLPPAMGSSHPRNYYRAYALQFIPSLIDAVTSLTLTLSPQQVQINATHAQRTPGFDARPCRFWAGKERDRGCGRQSSPSDRADPPDGNGAAVRGNRGV